LSEILHRGGGRRVQHEENPTAGIEVRIQSVGLLREWLCLGSGNDNDGGIGRDLEVSGQVKRLHDIAVFAENTIRNLQPVAFRTVDSALSVAIEEIDGLLLAFHQLHQGIRYIFFNDVILLFDALDFAVTRIQNNGAKCLLLAR
jgi:hypothetical protein